MITYCMNILGSHSEVTPPQNSEGALEAQQYRDERGTKKRAGMTATGTNTAGGNIS